MINKIELTEEEQDQLTSGSHFLEDRKTIAFPNRIKVAKAYKERTGCTLTEAGRVTAEFCDMVNSKYQNPRQSNAVNDSISHEYKVSPSSDRSVVSFVWGGTEFSVTADYKSGMRWHESSGSNAALAMKYAGAILLAAKLFEENKK